MKLRCPHCNAEAEITTKAAGPGLKALCSLCGRYIKFLDKEERLEVSGGSRPAREDVLAIAGRLTANDQQWLMEQLTGPILAKTAPTTPKKKEGFGRPYKNILPPLKKK